MASLLAQVLAPSTSSTPCSSALPWQLLPLSQPGRDPSMIWPGKPHGTVSGNQLFSRHRDTRGWGPGAPSSPSAAGAGLQGAQQGAHSTITCQLGTRQGLNHSFPVSLLTRGIVGQRPEQVQPQNVSSGVTLGTKRCTLKRRGEKPVKFLEELPVLC